MGKKQVAVTLRKPPQADAESFVASEEPQAPLAVKADVLAEAMRSQVDEVITRADGRAFREMTVYLPNDLARDLALHCMDRFSTCGALAPGRSDLSTALSVRRRSPFWG